MDLRSGRILENCNMAQLNELNLRALDSRYAPHYSGDGDIDEYFLKLQVFKNKKPDASDSDIIEDAIYSLSGRALKFYRINKDSITTFDDFKKQFKDEFGIKIDLQSAHSNLSSLKQSKSETIREFILEIKEAGQILAQVDNAMTTPVIESLMHGSFKNGLIQPFQEKVFDHRFTTFKEACDYALAIEW
jgi:hypothetical protein